MNRPLLSALIIALLILPLVPFSSCGEARPNVEEVIANAIKASDEVQTYRMNMESNRIEEGKPEQSSGWIEFVAPDRIHGISQQLTENGSGEE